MPSTSQAEERHAVSKRKLDDDEIYPFPTHKKTEERGHSTIAPPRGGREELCTSVSWKGWGWSLMSFLLFYVY